MTAVPRRAMPGAGLIAQGFDDAGRTGQLEAPGVQIHRSQRPRCGGVSRRSTTWPFFRCDSTISSMSCSST